jgi:hypothetical protein
MKSRKYTRPIILLAAIAIIAVVSYVRKHTSQNAAAGRRGANDLVLQVRSVPITNRMDLGSFVVPAGQSHEFKIVVDESRMRNPHLAGHFSTTGGAGIEVLLLDEDQFQNFQNKVAPSQVLYMSKTAPSGDIAAALPHGGTYYVVFDNSHGQASATVTGDVTVRFETVRVDASGDGKK